MPSRHRSRECAVQMIYQWDITGTSPEQVMGAYWGNLSKGDDGVAAESDPFANRLLEGVSSEIKEVDELIRKHSAHWRLERMAVVDRSILRMAVYEMLSTPELGPVVINEAIEIGRRFSGQESVPFLNGVLDAVRKSLQPNPSGLAKQPAG